MDPPACMLWYYTNVHQSSAQLYSLHWVWGESWLAIFNPNAPVLKAGHPVSCSSLCMLCVVYLVCSLLFGLLVSFNCLLWLVCYTHVFLHALSHTQTHTHCCGYTGSMLLESKVLPDRVYQKQEETLIVWTENESMDLALSFQEKNGCNDLWAKICDVCTVRLP